MLIKSNVMSTLRVVSDPSTLSSSLANHGYQAVIGGAVLKVTKCDNIL